MANDTPRDMPAGPDKLADVALARLCDELDFTPIERDILTRILRCLARRAALEAATRAYADARCSSQAAEDEAHGFDGAKRAAADAAGG
jgi:hypothetical protein